MGRVIRGRGELSAAGWAWKTRSGTEKQRERTTFNGRRIDPAGWRGQVPARGGGLRLAYWLVGASSVGTTEEDQKSPDARRTSFWSETTFTNPAATGICQSVGLDSDQSQSQSSTALSAQSEGGPDEASKAFRVEQPCKGAILRAPQLSSACDWQAAGISQTNSIRAK